MFDPAVPVRPRRRDLTFTLVLLAVLAPVRAHAGADLSWQACAPIQGNRSPGPGETTSTLYVSATGLEILHRGYSFQLWWAAELACGETAWTPDAWRFDSGGCQPRRSGEISLVPPSPSCPALYGAVDPTRDILEIRWSPPDFGTPSGAMRAMVAASYNERVQTPDPAKRYFMAALRFDHSSSVAGEGTPGVTCGGYETPLCFSLWSGPSPGEPCDGQRFSDIFTVGLEGAYDPIPIGEGVASFGLDPSTAFACFRTTPAAAATWGAVKAQYR